MGHGAPDSGERQPAMSAEAVARLAETLAALGTTSRLRILLRLRQGPCPVGELAVAVDMEQSAVSHQLRLLRHLGLVARTREGRHVAYRLHDGHVASLLDEAVHHAEHLRLGLDDRGAPSPTPAPAAADPVGTT